MRGQLGTYRILLGWAAAAVVIDSGIRWLTIPQRILDAVVLHLMVPIELDYRTEMVLRKAYVLADDWKIDSPDLIGSSCRIDLPNTRSDRWRQTVAA